MLFLSNFIVMCSNGHKSQNKLKIIDLEKGVIENDNITLDKIASTIEYIPLETNDSLLLGTIEAFITNENIIVINESNKPGLYLFNKKGKFIRKIGQIGQGPGEYGNIGSISINENLKSIFINTDIKKNIIKFNYDGIYSDFIDLGSCVGFIYYDSTIYGHKPSISFRGNNNEASQLIVFDTIGNIINKFHPVDINKTEYIDMFIESPVFSVSDDRLYYFIPREDTVYHLTKNDCVPFYQLFLGKFSFDVNYQWDFEGYSNARRENMIWVESTFITDSYIIFIANQKGQRRIIVYDKTKDRIYNNLINNVDHLPISFIKGIYRNRIVTSLSPFELLNYERKEDFPDNLKIMLNRIKENDNPVLRVVTLK